ncbi:XRE family transcriptional regulator [Enterococcus sp. CSURQ0835]|uniref:XRE family transcriptional regulator n=1 Tax=Enterococcus sp. CSURQ0835 TaxID=2681394 RepID=UPI00135A2A07|nr:XRE family transcriptional regulator [Enterococcus sp. CSURQ0835]
MIVDTKEIEWLLENRTQYFISKESGITQSKLSEIKNGKRKLENLTIAVGAKLTELAKQESKPTG